MKKHTIEEMKGLQAKSNDPEQYSKVLSLDKGKGIICKCGSKEFFFAPIVHVRCYICKKPL